MMETAIYLNFTDFFGRCLKLNGFVVDYLPFEQELSGIALLTCGKDCIDSGLRAPTTSRNPYNRRGTVVKNRCLIQWPNWTGVFDECGDQMPLTKESLQMKDLGEALDGAVKEDGYFSAQPPWTPGSAVTMTTSSRNASSVPATDGNTTTILSKTGSSAAEDTAFSDATSPTGASLVLVDSATSAGSTASNDDSYDHVSPVDIDEASAKTATAAKKGSFKHKVRRSWDWLSGSGSGAAS
jgi:hypothetical protein